VKQGTLSLFPTARSDTLDHPVTETQLFT